MPHIGGITKIQVGGVILNAMSGWTYNLGRPKRETVVGADRVHGYTETPQVGFLEGTITVTDETDVEFILAAKDVTVTLYTGKVSRFILANATFVGEGDIETDQGSLSVRFEGEGELDNG